MTLAFSIADVIQNPSDPWAWAGLVGDTLDLLPFVTGVGEVTRAVKLTNKAADTVKTVSKSDNLIKVVNKGRAGKQTRLRELANDDKLSSALRGEIKRDINAIRRGQRKTIRVPSGYHLSHRPRYSAKRGFSYKYADLNIIKQHRKHHSIFGWKF